MTDVIITGSDVLAERKARKMSRNQFAALTGLTPTKIGNIENGRAFKPGELEALQPFVTAGGTAPQVTEDLASGPSGPAGEGSGAESAPPTPTPAGPAVVTAPPSANGEAQDVIIITEDEEEEGTPDWTPTPPPPVTDNGAAEPTVVYVPPPVPKVELDSSVRYFANSEIQTWKRCKRKWWLAFYRRLGLPFEDPTGARAIGTRVHFALASWYVPDGQVRGNPLEVLEQTIQEDVSLLQDNPERLRLLLAEADLARAMVEGFMEWIAETGVDEGLTVIAPEQNVAVATTVPGVSLIGKLDVRARRDVDGAQVFIDWKTVGDLVQPTRLLPLDEQMLHYMLIEYLMLVAEGQQHERSVAALYSMLRKVKRTTTARPPFFDRVEVHHNEHELRNYYLHVMGAIREIMELTSQLDAGADPQYVAYPSPRNTCSWDCDFFHICPMFDDGSRVDDFIAENMVSVDPLKRYGDRLGEPMA